MHEMTIAESVLNVIEDFASKEEDCQRIKIVRLEIGKLSGVEVEAMRFCFDAVAQGTLAEGAELDIIEQDGWAWCFDCRRQVPVEARTDPCAVCGGFRLQMMEGTVMRVMEMEIE